MRMATTSLARTSGRTAWWSDARWKSCVARDVMITGLEMECATMTATTQLATSIARWSTQWWWYRTATTATTHTRTVVLTSLTRAPTKIITRTTATTQLPSLQQNHWHQR